MKRTRILLFPGRKSGSGCTRSTGEPPLRCSSCGRRRTRGSRSVVFGAFLGPGSGIRPRHQCGFLSDPAESSPISDSVSGCSEGRCSAIPICHSLQSERGRDRGPLRFPFPPRSEALAGPEVTSARLRAECQCRTKTAQMWRSKMPHSRGDEPSGCRSLQTGTSPWFG